MDYLIVLSTQTDDKVARALKELPVESHRMTLDKFIERFTDLTGSKNLLFKVSDEAMPGGINLRVLGAVAYPINPDKTINFDGIVYGPTYENPQLRLF